MIVNIHRINRQNCGDMSCSPLDYFSFPDVSQRRCIHNLFHSKEQMSSGQDLIIFGGGGLFYQNGKCSWERLMERHAARSSAPTVVWGAGINRHSEARSGGYPAFVSSMSLVGVRDFGLGHRWVPCPSCMHPAFDKEYKVDKQIGVFEHVEVKLDTELPKFRNSSSIEEALAFLGSCESVITNTYHGAYWATLLGKKVVVVPVERSSRFYFFKHAPKISEEYTTDFSGANAYEESLTECRDANVRFYSDCMDLFMNYAASGARNIL